MNLFKGKLTQSKGRLIFFNENFSLNGVDVSSKLGETDVEMGIRPEDIKVAHGRDKTLKAEVEMISNIGAEKYIHARMGTAGLTIRAAREAFFHAGDIIPLVIDPSKLHIFQNGQRVE